MHLTLTAARLEPLFLIECLQSASRDEASPKPVAEEARFGDRLCIKIIQTCRAACTAWIPAGA